MRPRRAASKGAILNMAALSAPTARQARREVGMQVILRTIDGLFFQLRVQPDDTVEEVKAMIAFKHGLPRAVQARLTGGPLTFVHNDMVLDDWATLAQSGVGNMHTIQVFFKLERRNPTGNPFQPASKR